MLSKKSWPGINRALRRGIPASLRKGERNPPSAADTYMGNLRGQYREEIYG